MASSNDAQTPGTAACRASISRGKGRELVQSLIPSHAEHVGELLSALEETERRELRRLLGKLRGSLLSRSPRKPTLKGLAVPRSKENR